MIKHTIENQCVGCADGCRNCGLDEVEVAHYFCDSCDKELPPEFLRSFDDQLTCLDCFKENAEGYWNEGAEV